MTVPELVAQIKREWANTIRTCGFTDEELTRWAEIAVRAKR